MLSPRSLDRLTRVKPWIQGESALPAPMALMKDISRDASWSQACESLEGAGFVLEHERVHFDRDWEGINPMACAPEPKNACEFKASRIYSHPMGLLLTMDSYQREAASRPATASSYDASALVVNALHLNWQADFGSDLLSGGQVGHSGGLRSAGDGSWIHSGNADPINGSSSLKCILMDLMANGSLIALKDWSREFAHAESRLFSDAPQSFMPLTRQEAHSFKARFGERLARDFESFILGLSREVGRQFDYDLKVLGPEHGPRSRPQDWDSEANDYLGFLLRSQGSKRATPADSAASRAWLSGFAAAMDQGSDLPDPCPGHTLSTGATALHVLASMPPRQSQALDSVGQWLDRIGPERALDMGSRADGSGRTPFGVALGSALEQRLPGRQERDASELHGALRALCERGMAGSPGEAGSIILEFIERCQERMFYSGAELLLILPKAIDACRAAGVDWLAPLSTPQGHLIEERSEAMLHLSAAVATVSIKSAHRAVLEALLLRDQIHDPKRAAGCAPRL